MAGKTLSSVDEKGRVLIPQYMRDALNLRPDEKVVLELDPDEKNVKIEPAHEKKLLHISILLADSPGSLAAAAYALAKVHVDLISTQSHSSSRGKAAVWDVECNPGKSGIKEIKAALLKVGAKILDSKWE